MKRVGLAVILLLAFAGLADNLYLAQHAATGNPLVCSIQNFTDCNAVADSPYSRPFGIPVAYIGVTIYTLLFGLALLEMVMMDRIVRRVIQTVAAADLLLSVASGIIQLTIIHAFCIYCLASGLIAVGIFALSLSLEPVMRRMTKGPQTEGAVLSMPPT